MIEITRQMSGMAKKLETLADTVDILTWVNNQEGLYFTIAAKSGGGMEFQAGGTVVDTVYPEIGNWLVFDGERFHVYADDDAFTGAGYEITE